MYKGIGCRLPRRRVRLAHTGAGGLARHARLDGGAAGVRIRLHSRGLGAGRFLRGGGGGAGRRAGRLAGLGCDGLYALAVAGNFAILPHPTPMVVAAAILIPLTGWLGARLASARPGHAARA